MGPFHDAGRPLLGPGASARRLSSKLSAKVGTGNRPGIGRCRGGWAWRVKFSPAHVTPIGRAKAAVGPPLAAVPIIAEPDRGFNPPRLEDAAGMPVAEVYLPDLVGASTMVMRRPSILTSRSILAMSESISKISPKARWPTFWWTRSRPRNSMVN